MWRSHTQPLLSLAAAASARALSVHVACVDGECAVCRVPVCRTTERATEHIRARRPPLNRYGYIRSPSRERRRRKGAMLATTSDALRFLPGRHILEQHDMHCGHGRRIDKHTTRRRAHASTADGNEPAAADGDDRIYFSSSNLLCGVFVCARPRQALVNIKYISRHNLHSHCRRQTQNRTCIKKYHTREHDSDLPARVDRPSYHIVDRHNTCRELNMCYQSTTTRTVCSLI